MSAMGGEITSVLCFDLDGTLVDPEGHNALDPTLMEYLVELKARGAVWVINTGRTLFQALEGFNQHGIRMHPDYIIAQESELYELGKFNRWVPFGDWNANCLNDHRKFFNLPEPSPSRGQKAVQPLVRRLSHRGV